ncbi:MAG: hypothetical protein ACOYS2_01615, partial [Patescibacteria group bacterium]
SLKMDKTLRNFIIVGIIAFSLASIFYFVYFPYKEKYDLNKCLESVEVTFSRKNSEITGHIADLEKQKEMAQKEADEKAEEFIKNNPRPEFKLLKVSGQTSTYQELKERGITNKEYLEWVNTKNDFFSPILKIDEQIRIIRSDYEKIEKEKEEDERTCYKKYPQN